MIENNCIIPYTIPEENIKLFPIFNNILFICEDDVSFKKCTKLHSLVEEIPNVMISKHYRDRRACDDIISIFNEIVRCKLLDV